MLDFTEIAEYQNPTRLKSLRSIFNFNSINNSFNSIEFIQCKLPHFSIKPLFIPHENPTVETTTKVPYNKYDCFPMSIPNVGLKDFYLTDSSVEKKSIITPEPFDIEKVKSLCMPKFLMSRPKCLKDKVDESFAYQVNLNAVMKPFKEVIPNPAWEWPFELDTFQQQAVIGLENGKSVFVAAHTSAGKTVVAEYAIAMCHNRGARVIYTSPIKALSNQKYREFKMTFGNENVGLLTGDIKTGANRYILVMTTEILHNMLKNDCTTLKDLDCVIMDEVHYLNDASRGHIWEQIMILLPKRIQLVMLSATVPNTMPFAEWLGRIRDTQIQVISTLKRPVPLEINLFTGNGRSQRTQLFKIMDSDKNFLTKGYEMADEAKKTNDKKAMKKFQAKPANVNQKEQNYSKAHKPSKFENPELKKQSANYNSTNKDHNQWLGLFEALQEQDKLPVICFLFSRNRIQETVGDLRSLDFLSQMEKSNVNRYFNEIINRKITNPADKQLPQILEMKELLLRGVAMHHAGLLPLLKEIVEILFSQGYVKVLFATETFAVGVNMPARSVVFDSLKKHDGSSKRLLLPGEFTQMAGRAGRRGLDKIGTVIVVIKPEAVLYSQEELKRTMIGSASQLESQFKISYNMILSLYRNRQFNIQHMIRHSFIEAGRLKNFEENSQNFKSMTSSLGAVHTRGMDCQDKQCNVDTILDYYKACSKYRDIKRSVTNMLESRNEINSVLTAGRLVLLDSSDIADWSSPYRSLVPAIVLSLTNPMNGPDKYKVKVLTYTDLEKDDGTMTPATGSKVPVVAKNVNVVPVRPMLDQVFVRKIDDITPKVLTLSLNDIHRICQFKTKIDVQELDKFWMTRFLRDKCSWSNWINKNTGFKAALSLICEDVTKKLDPINYDKEFNIKDSTQKQLLRQYFSYDSGDSPLLDYGCHDCISLADHLIHIDLLETLMARIEVLEEALSEDNLAFLPEYRSKVALLKERQFLHGARDIIRLKGRIACEIESYEMVVTELILAGALKTASPSNIAAALSCLMFESKAARGAHDQFQLKETGPELQAILGTLFAIVEEINGSQEQFGVLGCEVTVNCGLVEPVRMWVAGAKFADVVSGTEVQYGDVIRCMQRVAELMRHCESACKVMGDFEMAATFKRTEDLLYRGVVATPSLYVDDMPPQ